MAFFRKAKTTATEDLQAGLSAIAPLELGAAVFRPRVLAGGLRGNTPIPGVEVQVGGHAGWFHVEDLVQLGDGKMQIAESWKGSPAELFIARGTAAGAGSPAADAMAGANPEQAGILLASGERMTRLGLLEPDHLARLHDWAGSFPRR